jgi:ADP-ribose pyrophosphatase YjhB (NUDIX family)
MSDNYCNNCGKLGHIYNQCKMPITSIGIIAFRYNDNNVIEYLMIRRKDTLGFIDFMRGKYYIQNKFYILNMLKQMTVSEKELLRTHEFDELWREIWGNCKISTQYKYEENISKTKFNSLKTGVYWHSDTYNLNQLIDESNKYDNWSEPEWGFPKGRRNFQENDYACALREFTEETGIDTSALTLIENVMPYEEIFTGSNYKSYKHKYFLTYIKNASVLNMNNFEKSEVSSLEWKTYEQCIECVRPYNLEKIAIIDKINVALNTFQMVQLV